MKKNGSSLTWILFGLGLGLACGMAVFAAFNKMRRPRLTDARISRIEDLTRRADELLAKLQ